MEEEIIKEVITKYRKNIIMLDGLLQWALNPTSMSAGYGIKENYLQLKIQAVNNLNDQIEELEAAPAVLERIKHIINIQGFISEREFERLLLEKSIS